MVAQSDTTTATSIVSEWLRENHQRLSLRQVKLETAETHGKTLSARYETSEHLIQICVWDHAHCLDILVFDQSCGALAYSEAGPCESLAGVSTRLKSFLNWANAHVKIGVSVRFPSS